MATLFDKIKLYGQLKYQAGLLAGDETDGSKYWSRIQIKFRTEISEVFGLWDQNILSDDELFEKIEKNISDQIEADYCHNKY